MRTLTEITGKGLAERPEIPEIGTRYVDEWTGTTYVRSSKHWIIIPQSVRHICAFATAHGWTYRLEHGIHLDEPMLSAHIGRYAGPTRGERTSIGYYFRLTWTTKKGATGMELTERWWDFQPIGRSWRGQLEPCEPITWIRHVIETRPVVK